jgi:uncharacterized OB-fold protein
MKERVEKSGLADDYDLTRSEEQAPIGTRLWKCPNCGRHYAGSVWVCEPCLTKHNEPLEDLVK